MLLYIPVSPSQQQIDSFHEQVDMIFMYGHTNGNGHNAALLCQETFPDKKQPNHETFSAVYC